MRHRCSIDARLGLLGLLLLAALSCKRAAPSDHGAAANDRPVRQVVTTDDVPPELRDVVAEVSQRQADGGDRARATLRRAWEYAPPPELDPALNARLVAIELELDIPGTGFDLDDIDIIDAATGENYGSDPLLQCLTPSGEAVDFDDPAVGADDHHVRLLAVWGVPRAVQRVKLGYWQRSISGEIAIGATRPELRVIDETEAAIGYGIGPVTATGARSHYLLVEQFGSRVAPPPSYQLVNRGELLDMGRALEVDATMTPVTTPIEARPYYGRRTWLLEYPAPADIEVSALNQFGEHSELPRRAIKAGAAALAALARRPLEDL